MKMLALIARTIKNNRTFLLANILICVLFIWMFVAFFPTVQEHALQLQEAFKNYPEAFLKAFGVRTDYMFINLEAFLAIEYYSLVWPIIVIILVLTYGSAAIAGEIDRRTIEVLLAQPISRAKIYIAKHLAGIILILTFVSLSTFSVVPLAMLYNITYQWQSLLTISILGLLFALSVFSISMMLSSLSSSRGKVASVGGGILILMYGLDLVSKLEESVDNLKYLSFFHYFDYNAALIDHQIAPLTIAVFLGVGVVCTLMGLAAFVKRDVAT